MDSSIYIAAMLTFGLEMTLSILLLGNLLHAFFHRKTEWWKHLFNFAMFTIMISSAYSIFIISGGVTGSINSASAFSYLLSVVTYFLINTLIVSIYFRLISPTYRNILSIMKELGQETFLNYITTIALAFVLIVLLDSGTPLFGIFIFTFVVVLSSVSFVKYFRLYETLSNEKNHQEQILNSIPVGIITEDSRNLTTFFNSTAKDLLESDEEKVSALKKGHPTENKDFWDIFLSDKLCQNRKVSFKTRVQNHLLLVSQSPLYDQHRVLIGRNFHFIDITETAELEKRMYQSEKLAVLGELAAGAAHEIRNPLAVVHGFLTLMKEDFVEAEQKKFQIPLLLDEFSRINTIIEEMLMIAKPGALKLKEINVSEIVSEIPNLYKNSTMRQDITFNINLDRTTLLLDEKQIKQVMHNLIRNSIEAMNENGTITIFSKVEKGFYHVFVQDTGLGIPKDIQSSIFDPFLTSKETGTGLGLTIVQRIIENHRGSIQLCKSSEEGTTFVMSLPLPQSNLR